MAWRDEDNTMAALLRRSLATTAPAQGECPGTDLLAAYYERSLGSDEMPGCEAHVSQCSRCREELAMMARAEAPPEPLPRHAWLLDWRLLVPAATTLLILTVWGMHRPASKIAGDRTTDEPLVAMSRNDQSARQNSTQAPGLTTPPASVSAAQQSAGRESNRRKRLDAAVPQLQASAKQALLGSRNTVAGGLPDVAAGGVENSLKMKPQTAVEADRLAEAGAAAAAEEKKPAPAPSATVRKQPVPAAQPGAPPPSTTLSATANSEAPLVARNYSNVVGLSTAQQPANTNPTASGAANQKALAEPAEQRSAQTIIRTPDPKVLWRIAGGGFVERSQDGGATWNGQLPELNAHFTAGEAPSAKALWLVGENGMILVTKDAAHWKRVPPPIPADFVSVDAKSASSATVTAAGGQKFSTSNGGKKWVPAP